MTQQIVFISHFRIKNGMFADFKNHYLNSLPAVETGRPGTLAQLAYNDENTSEVSIVRIFWDSQAMDFHLQGSDTRSKAAYQFIEPTRMEIYGKPDDFAMQMIKKVAGSGIEVRVNPEWMGGFIRTVPG